MVTTNNFDKLRELNQKADAGGGEERARRQHDRRSESGHGKED